MNIKASIPSFKPRIDFSCHHRVRISPWSLSDETSLKPSQSSFPLSWYKEKARKHGWKKGIFMRDLPLAVLEIEFGFQGTYKAVWSFSSDYGKYHLCWILSITDKFIRNLWAQSIITLLNEVIYSIILQPLGLLRPQSLYKLFVLIIIFLSVDS